MAETFTGFPPSGIAFLAGLAADNTKTYFAAGMLAPRRRAPAPARPRTSPEPALTTGSATRWS